MVNVAINLLASTSKKTQSMKNNVPSEVTDFRVLHANHAISTAGDPLRAIGFGVHLDCAERSNGSQRKQRKRKSKKSNRRMLKIKVQLRSVTFF